MRWPMVLLGSKLIFISISQRVVIVYARNVLTKTHLVIIFRAMNAIFLYRKKNGLSQAAFAKLIGIRQTAVSNYENEIRKPNFKMAITIERVTMGQITRYELRPDVFGPAPDDSARHRRATDQPTDQPTDQAT